MALTFFDANVSNYLDVSSCLLSLFKLGSGRVAGDAQSRGQIAFRPRLDALVIGAGNRAKTHYQLAMEGHGPFINSAKSVQLLTALQSPHGGPATALLFGVATFFAVFR